MQAQEEHHHGVSPFCALPIDMIQTFPLDYMHQTCFGVMEKLLFVWIRGDCDNKLSANRIDEVGSKLLALKQFIPSIFARKSRTLSDIDRWKATELRQFLLYTGQLVMKGVLRADLYDHFMALHVAMAILVSPRLAQH